MIKELPDPRVLLAETDWNALDTCYGGSGGDGSFGPGLSTQAALAAFTSGDKDAITRVFNRIGDALLHQNTLYGATCPATLYVAALLADARSREALIPAWEAGLRPLRAKLLDWLAAVAHIVSDSWEEEWKEIIGDDYFWGSSSRVREIRSWRPAFFQGVSACLADPDSAVREAAHAAAIPLLDAPELLHLRTELIPVLRHELAVSRDYSHRLGAIVGLQAWGEDTTGFAAHAELIEFEQREKEWEEKRAAQGMRALHGPWADDEPPF
ncbi:hypothetical protein [Actinomadura sp. 9N407]|uniref:hypothetical protein n=1 Tax=Actinomadura sp. 9N407 TaxID=3375154 RepID=UPI00379D23F1